MTLSLARRRTDVVRSVIEKLAAAGRREFRPGDVVEELRRQNQPMGTWEVRGELSILQAEGTVALNPETAVWQLTPQRSLKAG